MSETSYLMYCIAPLAVLFIGSMIILVAAMCKAAGKADELSEKLFAEMKAKENK